MHLRPMLPEDVPDCVSIHIASFEHDKMFDYMAPYRHIHPLCYREEMVRAIKDRFYTVGLHCMLAVTDSDDADSGLWEGQEKILGLSIWARVGTDKTARAWQQNNQSIGTSFERKMIQTELKCSDLFHWNRAIHYSNRTKVRACYSGHSPFKRIPSYWYLRGLGVDPAFQRRGIGNLLVQWGTNIARSEGVPAVVVSSLMAEPVYRKAGFKAVEYRAFHADIHVGMAMVFDPREKYLRVFGEGEEVFEGGRRLDAAWIERTAPMLQDSASEASKP